mmetsp:Transcript_3687/g.5616  ORF Transcript_3687/g.5616 Transcript_3687/m.5616 type:complete len:1278 (+) Transcript_3687:54-3887(+)
MGNCKSTAHNQVVGPAYHDDNKGVFRYDKDSRQVVYMGEDAEATAITAIGSSEDVHDGDVCAESTSNSIEHQMPDDGIRERSLLGEISAFLEEDGDDSTVYSISTRGGGSPSLFSPVNHMKSPQGDEFMSPYYRHFNGNSTVDIQKTAVSPLVFEHETLEKYKVTNSAAYTIERKSSEDHTETSGGSGDSSTLNGLVLAPSSESSEYLTSIGGAISAESESESEDDSDVYNSLGVETHKSSMIFKPIAQNGIESKYDSNMILLDDDQSQSSLDDIQSALQTLQQSDEKKIDEGYIAITKSLSNDSSNGYEANKVLASGYNSGGVAEQVNSTGSNLEEFNDENSVSSSSVSSSESTSTHGKTENNDDDGHFESPTEITIQEQLKSSSRDSETTPRSCVEEMNKIQSDDESGKAQGSFISQAGSYSSQEDTETDAFVLAGNVDTVQPSLNDSSIDCAELHPSLLAPENSPGHANVMPDSERFPTIDNSREESFSQERDGDFAFSAHIVRTTTVKTKIEIDDSGEKGAHTPITLVTKDIVSDDMDIEGHMHRVHPLIEIEYHDATRSKVEDSKNGAKVVDVNSISFDDLVEYDQLMTKAFEADANASRPEDMDIYEASWLPAALSAAKENPKPFEEDNNVLPDSMETAYPDNEYLSESSSVESVQSDVEIEPALPNAAEENPKSVEEDNSVLPDSMETAYPDNENFCGNSSVESVQLDTEIEPALPKGAEENPKFVEEDFGVLVSLADSKEPTYPKSDNLSESSSAECDPSDKEIEIEGTETLFNKGSKNVINGSLDNKELVNVSNVDSSANDISCDDFTAGTTYEVGMSSDNDNGLSFDDDDDDTDLSISSSMFKDVAMMNVEKKSAANQRRNPIPEAKISSEAERNYPVVSHVPHENDKNELDNGIQPSAAEVSSLFDDNSEKGEFSGSPGITLSPETAPQVNKIDIEFCGRSQTAEFDNETQSLVDEISSLLDENVGNSEDSGDKKLLHSPESVSGEPRKTPTCEGRIGVEGALSDDISLDSEDESLDLAGTAKEDICIATPTKSESAVKSVSFLLAVAGPQDSPSRRTLIPRFPQNSPVRYSSPYRGNRNSLMQQPSPVRVYSRTPPLVPDPVNSTASARKTPANQHMKANTSSQFSASSTVSSSDQTITPLPWDEQAGKKTYRKLLKTPKGSKSTSEVCCAEKWDPYLHADKGGCERCLTLCSRTEAEDFFKFGRHTRVSRTGGGCTKNCSKYAGERYYDCDSIRLCRICFNAVHRKSKVLVQDTTVRSLNTEYF